MERITNNLINRNCSYSDDVIEELHSSEDPAIVRVAWDQYPKTAYGIIDTISAPVWESRNRVVWPVIDEIFAS